MKERFWQAENHMKGKEPSAVEDPHPELAYIAPMPQDEKSGFFSRMGHKHGGQHHETRNADVDMEVSILPIGSLELQLLINFFPAEII